MLLPEMPSEEIELVGEEGASSGLTSSRAWLSASLVCCMPVLCPCGPAGLGILMVEE